MTRTVNLINIPINITENKVDREQLFGENKCKILTFSVRRLVRRNDVLDEKRTAEGSVESSRAHARLS